MHEIVVTEALVLGKRGVGEANSVVALLTRDRGLLYASARSSRAEQSKLRYGLQTLNTGRFSLVRGKREWRLTGVERVQSEFSDARVTPARRTAAGRIAKLLLRLVAGEEHTPKLYDDVTEGFKFLAKPEVFEKSLGAAEDFSKELSVQLESIEVVLVLRMLSRLGYLPSTPALAPFVEGDFSFELAAEAARSRGLLIKTINESLGATGF